MNTTTYKTVKPAPPGQTPLTLRYGAERRWVNWKLEPNKDGKSTKVPYRPNGYKADTTNPETWSTLAQVQAAMQMPLGFSGIGIVFAADMLSLGVDLDHVLDASGKVQDANALKFLQVADSNGEKSPSGDGVHVMLELTEPLQLERNKTVLSNGMGYECYTKGRFFTVTGKGYGAWGAKPIRKISPDEAVELLQLLGYPWAKASKANSNGKHAPAPNLDDDTLIERIRKSKGGAKFERLFDRGDLSDYNSDDSAADLGLCTILAWWTRKDAGQIERLWLQSALGKRDKVQDRADYRTRTVDAAIGHTASMYEPQARSPGTDDTPSSYDRRTCDDIGNGYRFADQHAGHACYVFEWGWMAYDGKRWMRDRAGRVMKWAKETAKEIWNESADAQKAARDGEEKVIKRAKALTSWAAQSRSRGRLEAMLAMAQSEMTTKVEDFDRDPFLLNVQNGTLELRTSNLRPHEAKDMLTRICSAPYDKATLTPQWTATLDRFLPPELKAFIKRCFGLACSGQTEKAFFFLHGAMGNNGKSTLTNVVSQVLGDYAMRFSIDVLMSKHRSAGEDDQLAALAGARFVVSNEVDDRQMNTRLIKDLTGEMDLIRTKFMGQNTFEFQPRFKLFVYGNKKPRLDATDQALWNRVKCIPFERVIPESERIANFAERLRPEFGGILAWLVEGFTDYLQQGLNPPEKIAQATAAYRGEMDALAEFLEECCIVQPSAVAVFADLHAAYEAFSGEKMEPRELSKQLKAHAFEAKRGTGGKRTYRGIGLVAVTGETN